MPETAAVMGEWRHVADHFGTLIEAVAATPSEHARARSAAAQVGAVLRRAIESDPSPALAGPVDHLVIGGFAKGTALRVPAGTPPAVDMLYVLPDTWREEAAALERVVLSGLGHGFAATAAPEGWFAILPPVGEAAVRLVPAFACRRGGFLAAPPGSGWRHLDPLGEMAALRRADRLSHGKATHLILMLKAWRRQRGVALSSLALEILVTEFVALWTYQRRSLFFYDWMVRDFFFWLGHQGRRELRLPGGHEVLALGDGWLADAHEAHAAAEAGCAAERESRGVEAARVWREMFGPAETVAPGGWPQPQPRRPATELLS